MPAPLVIAGAAYGVSKLLQSIFGGQAKKSQAKEVDRAARETHKVSDAARGDKNAASQALLRSLFGGRYAVDEGAFGNIMQPRPYTGADPSKGMGWGLASDIAGGVSDLAGAYGMMNYPEAPGVSPEAGTAAAQQGGLDALQFESPGGIATSLADYPAAPVPTGGVGQAGVSGQQYSLYPWEEE